MMTPDQHCGFRFPAEIIAHAVEIARHLGMEAEQVLRLKREHGIASQFANEPFGKAWVRDTTDVILPERDDRV